ncbi:hypothetical protein [Fimbriiglobus ruber]|uniref:hypothetical protein n=1 Tax=Fimbriiglobus ruber TaxID=1908690 RepID=UPI001179B185|nr:hypothetical protein [Fimbriiglobus ruber]
MMRWCLILLPLLLTGCLEDKVAILSECRLKYDQDGAGQQGVMLCMSAKGYEFESAWLSPHDYTAPNKKCWTGNGSSPLPVNPSYVFSDCYSKRSLWSVFSH